MGRSSRVLPVRLVLVRHPAAIERRYERQPERVNCGAAYLPSLMRCAHIRAFVVVARFCWSAASVSPGSRGHYASVMIREATPADTPTIATLIRALAEYERRAHEVTLDESELRTHLFGDRRYAEVLLAEQDREIVGFALFFHYFSTYTGKPGLYLEDLFVLPEHRGNGHGKALLAALAQITIERGCSRLEWSVLDWNQPPIAFYRALGAEQTEGTASYRLSGDPLSALAAQHHI